MASEPETVVLAYVEACNREDLGAVLELLDPDVELHEADELPGDISAVGIEAVHKYLASFGAHWSSFHWQPLETRVDGDRVLMRARLALTGRKSGLEVDREWVYLFTVRDGKLLRQDGYGDMESGVRALEAER